MSMKFYFSVIRIVPDPIKFEPVNVGVAVISEDGTIGDVLYNRRVKTRLSSFRRDFPLPVLLASIDDLRYYLGLEAQQ